MPEMDEGQLRSIVGAKITDSLGYMGGMLSQERLKAEQYYKGEPFGDEQVGQSQVVSRDVAESIDSMLPALLKVFGASAQTGVFQARRPDAEECAKQATDYINYQFHTRNKGFLILHDWFKDALLKKLGVVKSWWDETQDVRKETYNGLTDIEMQMIENDDEVKIVKQSSYAMTDFSQHPNPALAMANPPQLHDVVLKRTKTTGRICIMPVAPEEFLCDHRAVSTEESPFLAHRSKKTVSALIEEGFDRDTVEGLAPDGAQDFNQETIERFKDEDAYPYRSDNYADLSMREIWVTECYIKVDYDGDGIAELRKVTVAGESSFEILDNEEVDSHPFSTLTPVPMPHKLFGRSVADQTMDIQQIKSAMIRGLLNSIYLQNAPRMGMIDGQVNLDDLLDVRPGGVVRMKRQDALTPIETVPVSAEAFQMIEYQDTVRETRTGVRRFASSLSENTINPYSNTATGVNDVAEASDDRLQLIARIFAETGMTHLWRRMLELVCKNQKQKEMIRLRGKFVEMDPREWTTELDMQIAVGLGTGDRSKQLQRVLGLAPIYDKLVMQQQGQTNGPFVVAQNLYNWLNKVVEASELRDTELYFTDPSTQPPQQQAQQPDPKMVAANAQAQAAQMKSSQDAQNQQVKTAADIQLANAKAANDRQLAEERQQHEMQLDRQRASEDMQVAQFKARADLAAEMAEIRARAASGAYTDND